jgi:hypothetical protein
MQPPVDPPQHEPQADERAGTGECLIILGRRQRDRDDGTDDRHDRRRAEMVVFHGVTP